MVEREELAGELGAAARLLRESPEPSDLWRQRLLHEVEAAAARRSAGGALRLERMPRRWSIHPLAAIASALVCAIIGAGTVTLMTSRTGAPAASMAAATAPVHRVRFSLVAPTATRVSIVGDFNGWNPGALPLRRSADGRTWEVEVPLAPGRYAYSFVVDGALARDPSAPQATDDDFGTANSIVMVKGS